jgi:hypothetical protein
LQIVTSLVSALKRERAENVDLWHLLKAIQAQDPTVDSTVYKMDGPHGKILKILGGLLARQKRQIG